MDKYDANDLKALWAILPKLQGLRAISVSLGEADVDWGELRAVAVSDAPLAHLP